MRYLVSIILFLILFSYHSVLAQSGFTAPDTVCAGTSFSPVIKDSVAETFFWRFCSDNVSPVPSGVNLGNIGKMNGPAFVSIAEDSGNYYAFVVNYKTHNLMRYRFGTSLLNNAPVADSLGSFNGLIPDRMEGIQVKKDGGKWYGYIVGGFANKAWLLRLEFGTSLQNTPAAYNLGNPGSMSIPTDLNLIKDNGKWTGFVIDNWLSKLFRFDFDSLGGKPTIKTFDLSSTVKNPFGICTYRDGGDWYMFIANKNGIARLSFGNSLTNTPSSENMGGSPPVDNPYDLVIIRDCDVPYGLMIDHLDGTNKLYRIDLPSGIKGGITYTPLGNVGNLNHPNSFSDVYRENDQTFTFVVDIDNNTISRIYFQTCTDPSRLTSTDKHPLPTSYPKSGNYRISLLLNQNLPSERIYCKYIRVLDKPSLNWSPDTTVCPNQPVTLKAKGGYPHYLWQDKSFDSTLVARDSGLYWVSVYGVNNCEAKDTIVVKYYPDNLFLGNDTSFTLGQAITLNAGSGYRIYSWSTGENSSGISVRQPGIYAVVVTDFQGCNFSDTIKLSLQVALPNFFTPNGDGYNEKWEPQLFYHYPEAEIKIFDRYGKLVASFSGSELYSNGWDGTYDGKLANPDTYWYVVDLKNGMKPFTGQVTIKR